ncbi:hypothetical protein BJF93_22785 [Xaviernesmea oryzae]|uniref:Uncharacterized protein n=1 Tax=Xaviernesmea oryzae TaxID=464029 RepID=A0A1Q9AU37_9HYPH|nr:hypothetical protein [Xaviernesmea oryzae]OLP58864.1 hypothetical protein BJF93_22785 [Xaviernesmea oryzae]SEM03522.1 hypothetical protein SAMN04487976_117111 [Xaviernesmea oryzae]
MPIADTHLVDVEKHRAPKPVQDHDDYGGVGADEFGRRIKADNEKRHGDTIRNSDWKPFGEAGW